MPLNPRKTKKAEAKNILILVREGRKPKQANAIAVNIAGKKRRKPKSKRRGKRQ